MTKGVSPIPTVAHLGRSQTPRQLILMHPEVLATKIPVIVLDGAVIVRGNLAGSAYTA
jgi:hypothetical protein